MWRNLHMLLGILELRVENKNDILGKTVLKYGLRNPLGVLVLPKNLPKIAEPFNVFRFLCLAFFLSSFVDKLYTFPQFWNLIIKNSFS